MVFNKKLVKISPQMDWYIYFWPQDGKMRYMTAVLVKKWWNSFFSTNSICRPAVPWGPMGSAFLFRAIFGLKWTYKARRQAAVVILVIFAIFTNFSLIAVHDMAQNMLILVSMRWSGQTQITSENGIENYASNQKFVFWPFPLNFLPI